jgi:cell division protease FtsH
MVTEFGMSDVVGPRAWGTSAPVFLGEDFGQQKEYSEETARLIDVEVEKMLRVGEDRCREILDVHRHALDLIARSLLEHETISGHEVNRLIGAAAGTVPVAPAPAPAAAPAPPQSLAPAPSLSSTATPAPTTPPPVPPHLRPESPGSPPALGPNPA